MVAGYCIPPHTTAPIDVLLNPAKQSKQAKQASKQANQQIGLG
jgi:hypothetical protein